jgi:hypothetical protein
MSIDPAVVLFAKNAISMINYLRELYGGASTYRLEEVR